MVQLFTFARYAYTLYSYGFLRHIKKHTFSKPIIFIDWCEKKVYCLMTCYVYNSSHNCMGNNIVVVLLVHFVLVKICHIMTQKGFMLYTYCFPYNCGNCYTHNMSLNNILKKKQLHFQFLLLLTIKLNYLHDLIQCSKTERCDELSDWIFINDSERRE
jgi:hypothetical protein